MADEEQPAAQQETTKRIVKPEKVYIKDVSFETPNSPEIFLAKEDMEVSLLMDSTSKDLGEDVYEVVLSVTLTVKMGEQTAYLAEVHQAGIFTITGLTPEQLHRNHNVFCLRFLHPYASAAISDLVTKGGFPQFIVPPVNFDKRYADRYETPEKSTADRVPELNTPREKNR